MMQRPPRFPSVAPFAVALLLSLLLGACADGERTADTAPAAGTAAPSDADGAQSAPGDIAAPAATGTVANAAALVGVRVPPYPGGLIDIVGSCIPGGEGLEHVCDYGISVLGQGDRDAGTAQGVYLVGTRNTDPAADMPVWEITDALDMPAADGYVLQIADCRVDGQPLRSVAALVRHGGEEFSTDIAWSRLYDTATGKFVEAGSAKIDCIDPGAGV